MGIDIEKHLGSAVAEPVLGVLNADAVFRKSAGMVVAEFMKGDSKDGRFDEALKRLDQLRGSWGLPKELGNTRP